MGNTRLSDTLDPATSSLKVLEESHYYPFGLKHQGYNDNVKDLINSSSGVTVENTGFNRYQYKYNGKEYQDELGLNWNDYGARNYDPAIGRWMNVDPLAEKFSFVSPYIYVVNNPVMFIDPDGKDIFIPNVKGNSKGAENVKNSGTILKNLQKLSNNTLTLVKTRGGFLVKDTGKQFKGNEGKKLTEGTGLIQRLSTHEKTVSIQQAVGSEVNLAGYQKNGDVKVTINLENEADGKKGNMIQNADGTYGRQVQIGLGHELKHAENYMDGTQDNTAVNVVNPDKNTNPEKTLKEKL